MKIERENEETLKKLERLLGQSLNTKDCVDRMIQKCSLPFYTEPDMKEDLKGISNNLDAIMSNIDPIFRLYLILPANVENENAPNFLNTRKTNSLVKYENFLLEGKNLENQIQIFEDNNLYNSIINEASNSPNNPRLSETRNNENYSKAKESMNTISNILSERLKKNLKDNSQKMIYKNESSIYSTNNYEKILDTAKQFLNKK